MIYRDRTGHTFSGNERQDRFLRMLYGTTFGRILLKPLIQPGVSKFCGMVLNSRLSGVWVWYFIRKHHISLSDYQTTRFRSWNAFFRRKFRLEQRPIDMGEEVLISPCDGKLTCYSIQKDSYFPIKNNLYSMETLIRDRKLAKEYAEGTLLVFRLTVDDYHRFCYIADGEKSVNVRIPGVFHTVNPIAEEKYLIYHENTRQYSVLETEKFGKVLMMEVGAMLVGKIRNHHEKTMVYRGQEKGYFEFGGSTILLAFQKEKVFIDQDILENSDHGIETLVRLGERIGIAIQ